MTKKSTTSGKKNPGHRWKKGQSGNPGGKTRAVFSPKPGDFKPGDVRRIIFHYITIPPEELQKRQQDKTLSVFEHILMQILVDMGTSPDIDKFNMLLDRLIGKVVPAKEPETPNEREVFDKIPSTKLIALLDEAKQEADPNIVEAEVME